MNKKILFFSILVLVALTANIAYAQTLKGALNQLGIVFQSIVVSIAIIGWSIAAILYLTSAGSPTRMQTAKMALIAAVIGTILAILAYNSTFWNVIQDALNI